MGKRRKPVLTPAECRYFDAVHQDIIRWGRHPSTMDQAFCDTHDGNLYEEEVEPLIRKRLLIKIPMEFEDQRCGRLLGCRWSVFLTPYAIRIFWPDKALTESHQAKGGRARAANLKAEQRSAIARKAAQQRWHKTT